MQVFCVEPCNTKRKTHESFVVPRQGTWPKSRNSEFFQVKRFQLAGSHSCKCCNRTHAHGMPAATTRHISYGTLVMARDAGSHHQLRKLDKRIDLVKGATSKAGGACA